MHPAFFYPVLSMLVLIALAATPGAPFADFANTFIAVFFTLFAATLSILGVLSFALVGILSLGLIGWGIMLVALLFVFRLQFNYSFVIAALGLFAVMLLVV